MRPAPFQYVRARSALEAAQMLGHNPGARILSGGQTLIPELTRRAVTSPLIVDLKTARGMDTAHWEDAGLTIGALCTLSTLEAVVAQRPHARYLQSALAMTASPAIRYRATVGGTVALASSTSELLVALLLGTTSCETVDADGNIRTRDLNEFFTTRNVGDAEVLTTVRHTPPDGAAALDEYARQSNVPADVVVGVVSGFETNLLHTVVGIRGRLPTYASRHPGDPYVPRHVASAWSHDAIAERLITRLAHAGRH